MNRVLWLGAGASAGSKVSGCQRRRPPTIKHFFREAQLAGIHQPDDTKRLLNFIQERYGISESALTSENPPVTIETLLSFFDIEERLQQYDFAFDLSHGQLLKYIREVVIECGGVPGPGESCALHAAIASTLDPTDAVISFNWDLIMDKALADSGRWNEWAGYAPMTFNRIDDVERCRDGVGPTRDHFRHPSELTYLKLHGSLNWWWRPTRRTPEPEELNRIEQQETHPQRYVCSLFTSHVNRGNLTSAVHGSVGRPYKQLLIPPTMHKNYETFQPLWVRAEEVLARAKELVIVGFSFAPADTQAQWLLHRGLAQNPNAVSVILVDPNKRTSQRIGEMTCAINSRHQIVRQYDNFGEYVTKECVQLPL
ncbi:MAG: hypothetical protein Q8R91_09740 [Candidatus Omnitrophota bacterium]|nr:hypothetical protein [Candidatus Omnitrophota bacterium]